MKRFIAQLKSTTYGTLIWRVFIGVTGGLVTVAGLFLLVIPGPGLPFFLAGLGILATEFAWASRAILKAKSAATTASRKVRIPIQIQYAIAAVFTLISIIAIAFLHF